MPHWRHVDGWVVSAPSGPSSSCWLMVLQWLRIKAKNGFAQAGELSLLAIDVSEPAPTSSTTPASLSRQPTPAPEVTPSVIEAGLSKERHDEDSGAAALAAGAQDDDVEMAGLGAGTGNGGVIPGVESGAVASDKDSGMTDMDWGPAGNMGMVEESDNLPPAPWPRPQLSSMGTWLMLPSGWQEWVRVEAKAKGTGNMVASGSRSRHWPQTLVGVVIDWKHTVADETGKTGVGLTADKCHQMNTFGVDRKSTGKVEVEVLLATSAKGHACRPKVTPRKVLSKVVVEDLESDGGVEVVLGPSKAVKVDNPATFSFPAPNGEKVHVSLHLHECTASVSGAGTYNRNVQSQMQSSPGP
ncbi:hypothetical protein DXG03_008007 [Asterophora parasitica]|uniref:Uncharacterized protein n=1 Tax=Asterophora parasitica TaxID=117018 RepID=A0A9P7FYE9_9AGAR|nr:hypothetical protein DXG03_008007 [Asterophora parasitica]